MEPAKNPMQQENALHFLDYWRIIRIRKTVIISVFLLISITATLVTFILPRYYASTTRIEINQDASSSVIAPAQAYSPYDPYFIETEFQKMQSQQVLGRVISQLGLNEKWGKIYNGGTPLKTEDTLELLKQRLSLSPERNTKLIDITVYDEDAQQAADLANAVASAYYDYRLAEHTTNTMQDVKAMEDNYNKDEQNIDATNAIVQNLRKELNIIDTDPNATAPSPTLSQAGVQRYNDLRIERKNDYMRMAVIVNQLKELQRTNPSVLPDVLPTLNPNSSDPALNDLLTKLHSAQQQLAEQSIYYTTNLPDIQSLQSITNELTREINSRVQGIMASLDAQVASMKVSAEQIAAELESAKSNDLAEANYGQPYWEAKQKLESMRNFHKLVALRIAQEKLDLESPKTQMVTLVDSAQPGRYPVKPNKTINIVLGIFIGLIVGIGLAFFIEYLDTSVKTIDDVERTLQAPVLGVIPQNIGLLMEEGAESPNAEAYRVLRTNLLFSRKDDKLNTIVVVSAGSGEGKSTTVVNLATVFAHTGQRVLLVDSDLRRPTLHKLTRVSNSSGLTNYLLKQNTLEEVIQHTSVPTLDVLASGKLPSSSINILGSTQMKEMISELKQRYDFIFFDSPPIMGVSDSAVLASEVDLVIQVIQYRRYPQPMNIRAKQMIEKVGGNLVGIVLNNINISQDENYYYYSGYNYQEQYAEESTKDHEDDGRAKIKQKY